MARIRSIHPGCTTDEAFLAMSMAAKAAWPHLWTQCDDYGAFEWKPLTLKARIMPVDAVDFAAILAEWEQLGVVKKYEHGGRQLGLVRNFCRWQRPKKPQSTYFIPDEFRTFIGSSADSSELDDDEGPSSTEPEAVKRPSVPPNGGTHVASSAPSSRKSPQREEGGWRMEDGGGSGRGKRAARAAPLAPLPFDAIPEAWRSFVTAEGSGLDADRVFLRFRDYHLGKGSVKADWEATWRNWVRHEKPSKSGTFASSPAPAATPADAATWGR